MPEETGTAVPEISFGYDTKSYGGVFTAGNTTKANSYMVGFTWKDMFQADDRIGVAFTQPLAATEVQGDGATGEVDPPAFCPRLADSPWGVPLKRGCQSHSVPHVGCVWGGYRAAYCHPILRRQFARPPAVRTIARQRQRELIGQT